MADLVIAEYTLDESPPVSNPRGFIHGEFPFLLVVCARSPRNPIF